MLCASRFYSAFNTVKPCLMKANYDLVAIFNYETLLLLEVNFLNPCFHLSMSVNANKMCAGWAKIYLAVKTFQHLRLFK